MGRQLCKATWTLLSLIIFILIYGSVLVKAEGVPAGCELTVDMGKDPEERARSIRAFNMMLNSMRRIDSCKSTLYCVGNSGPSDCDCTDIPGEPGSPNIRTKLGDVNGDGLVTVNMCEALDAKNFKFISVMKKASPGQACRKNKGNAVRVEWLANLLTDSAGDDTIPEEFRTDSLYNQMIGCSEGFPKIAKLFGLGNEVTQLSNKTYDFVVKVKLNSDFSIAVDKFGRPIVEYDANGEPVLIRDANGNPIPTKSGGKVIRDAYGRNIRNPKGIIIPTTVIHDKNHGSDSEIATNTWRALTQQTIQNRNCPDSRGRNLWLSIDTTQAFDFNYDNPRVTGGNASEQIFELPNGYHAYCLFDGKGNPALFAPTFVVRANTSQELLHGSRTIYNGAAFCGSCHGAGPVRGGISSSDGRDYMTDNTVKDAEVWLDPANYTQNARTRGEKFVDAKKLGCGDASNGTAANNVLMDMIMLDNSLEDIAANRGVPPEKLRCLLTEYPEIIPETQRQALLSGKKIGRNKFEKLTCEFDSLIEDAKKKCDKLPLSVTVGGTGVGQVVSSPKGISCTNLASVDPAKNVCSAIFPRDTEVTLVAKPKKGSFFEGWSGACTGKDTCKVKIDGIKAVNAIFSLDINMVIVTVGGNGRGKVVSDPTGINCGTTLAKGDFTKCSANFSKGTDVTLTPTADKDSEFAGWGGACTGTGVCKIAKIDGGKTVTASFVSTIQRLDVTVGGTGKGVVTSEPTGISCDKNGAVGKGKCNAVFSKGTKVTLTPKAENDSEFAGWSGACSGKGACELTLTEGAYVVSASFISTIQMLSVTVGGTGKGTVSSAPAGISCDKNGAVGEGKCSAHFSKDTKVTLTASAEKDSEFVGWTGACSGKEACTITLKEGVHAVTAAFNSSIQNLGVTVGGTGNGTVSSNPEGISCDKNGAGGAGKCNASFSKGTEVTLTAKADKDSIFSGWTGACKGAENTCKVSMEAVQTVGATFNSTIIAVIFSSGGTGRGSLTSSAAGSSCTGAMTTCSFMAHLGDVVTVTASPDSTSVFSGWTGACSGTSPTCTFTVGAANGAIAIFNMKSFIMAGTPGGI